LQEDKEALFDTIDTLSDSLLVTATVLGNIELHRERARAAAISDYTNATELADYLVRKGLEFRRAHEIIGRVVVFAIEQGKQLDELRLDEYLGFSELFEQDLFDSIRLENSLAGKRQTGGTAPAQVARELAQARSSLTV
jgi:argininosuccinate lyase